MSEEQPSDKELAEAAALARALEGEPLAAGDALPQDALEVAGLLRLAQPSAALEHERAEAVLADVLRPVSVRPRKRARWAWGVGVASTFAVAALCLLMLRSQAPQLEAAKSAAPLAEPAAQPAAALGGSAEPEEEPAPAPRVVSSKPAPMVESVAPETMEALARNEKRAQYGAAAPGHAENAAAKDLTPEGAPAAKRVPGAAPPPADMAAADRAFAPAGSVNPAELQPSAAAPHRLVVDSASQARVAPRMAEAKRAAEAQPAQAAARTPPSAASSDGRASSAAAPAQLADAKDVARAPSPAAGPRSGTAPPSAAAPGAQAVSSGQSQAAAPQGSGIADNATAQEAAAARELDGQPAPATPARVPLAAAKRSGSVDPAAAGARLLDAHLQLVAGAPGSMAALERAQAEYRGLVLPQLTASGVAAAHARADAALARKQPDQALKLLEDALTAAISSNVAGLAQSDLAFRAAALALKNGDAERAQRDADRGIARAAGSDPTLVSLLRVRAQAERSNGDPAAADISEARAQRVLKRLRAQ